MLDRTRLPACMYAAAVLILGSACGDRSPRIDAPAPIADSTDAPTAYSLPPSRLDVPVTLDLGPIIADLENAVPRTFGDIEDRQKISSNDRIEVAYEAERSPFQAELSGDTARLTALIRYRARGWYNPPVAPTISASCGTAEDHDDRPAALVTVSSRLRLDRNWRLRSSIVVDTVRPASNAVENECRITAFRIDATGKVLQAARDLLEDEAPHIDSIISHLDLRSQFREWWDLIRTPIQLTDSVWLLIDPVAVRRGSVAGTGRSLHATVGLTAMPRIVVGRRPDEPTQPLPQLENGAVDPGLHILVEGLLEYSAINHILNREFADRSFERAGHSIRIRDLGLYGLGHGRLALRVEFTGDARGHVFFVGTPVWDPVSGLVTVPDLDFDIASSSLLVRGLDWLRHDDFVSWMRDQARWPVDDAVDRGRELLLEGLNRDLSDAVRLTGQVESVVPLAVLPDPRALRVQAHARASAHLTVR